MSQTRYRQQQQILELERFLTGDTSQHPDPELYGSGWGDPFTHEHLRPAFDALSVELLRQPTDKAIVEIGCGGGRWSSVIQNCRSPESFFAVIDGTLAAITLTSQTLQARFGKLPDLGLICEDGEISDLGYQVDLVFSFDVFVHFDLPLMTEYLNSVARILKPGGKFLVNFACDYSEADQPGWQRSDEWFEYVVRLDRDGATWWHQEVADILHANFTGMTKPVQNNPIGYGSAFFVLTRK